MTGFTINGIICYLLILKLIPYVLNLITNMLLYLCVLGMMIILLFEFRHQRTKIKLTETLLRKQKNTRRKQALKFKKLFVGSCVVFFVYLLIFNYKFNMSTPWNGSLRYLLNFVRE